MTSLAQKLSPDGQVCDANGVTLCVKCDVISSHYVYYVTLHIVCDLHLVTCDAVFLMWLTLGRLWHNLLSVTWLRSWRNSSRVMRPRHTRRYTSCVTFIERLSTFNDDPPSIDHLSASSIIQLNERKRFCQPKEKIHFKEWTFLTLSWWETKITAKSFW